MTVSDVEDAVLLTSNYEYYELGGLIVVILSDYAVSHVWQAGTAGINIPNNNPSPTVSYQREINPLVLRYEDKVLNRQGSTAPCSPLCDKRLSHRPGNLA